MRLFTAIEIPVPVAASLEGLKGGVPNARWVAPEDFHLTLAFIGEVEPGMATEIDGALAEISRVPFPLRLQGIGAFGGNRPRAIWAGVAPEPALSDLQAEIAWVLTRSGARAEGRKFAPHVTLARLKRAQAPAVAAYLARHGDYESAEFEVNRFVLLSSRPSKGGAPYVTERDYPLLNGLDEREDGLGGLVPTHME